MRNFKVTVNGKQYDVQVEEVGAVSPVSAPAPIEIKPVVQAAPAPAVKAAPAPVTAPAPKPVVTAGGSSLTAPMPGMVMSFKVAEGTAVKKGQPVLVLEAMKMENDIAANADGIISFVATKGSNVNSGDVLAVIK